MTPLSFTTTPLAGRRVLVMGLGQFGGGVGVTRFLCAQGAIVTVTDTAPADKLTSALAQLADLPQAAAPGGVIFKLGGHDPADFTAAELLITNPAVDKKTSPHVQAALAAGVPTTTEMNLFLERCPAYTIGITGSVGKSTTTMLVYLALQAAMHAAQPPPRVFLGGNIGKSLLSDLPSMSPADIVVLELSSFMLEETPHVRRPDGSAGWSPNLAVITNLFPNHLDRHGTLDDYAAAKQNILRFQAPKDIAIFNQEHPIVTGWQRLAHGKVATFTTLGAPALPMLMPGRHNQSNARAALAVVSHVPFATDLSAAQHAIQNFKGLAHRLELVHASHLAGHEVRWYNDSKATTPEASITALEAFPAQGAIFIIGGYDKHVDLSSFENLLARRAAGVLGIGQTGAAMIERIRAAHPLCAPRALYVETLERAVAQAWEWIKDIVQAKVETPAVVLSPASASWGQFQNYERRGERFAELARACT